MAEPQWSATALCARWSMMIGGDGGTASLLRDTAFAPTRRYMAVVDRQFPKPAADDRLAFVARLAADQVLGKRRRRSAQRAGHRQTLLRSAVKRLLQAETSHSVAAGQTGLRPPDSSHLKVAADHLETGLFG
ncbi:hypothetical protein ACH4T9_19145 [Micromonospora sp. NPDC020750]|uniref:hypothetical protein n=1 Tax=unclassified Micromonospora TaxID=2617518 RepID=UPI0037A72542